MEIGVVIFLVLMCALMLYFARNHFGKLFGILVVIFFITTIIVIIGTFLIIKDLSDLEKDITSKKSIFVIKDETKTYSAVGIVPTTNKKMGLEDLHYYNKTMIQELENNIKNNDFEDSDGRIFVMSPELLDKELELDLGISLNQADLLEIVKSDKPYVALANIITRKSNVTGIGLDYAINDFRSMFGPDEELKGYVTSILIVNYFSKAKLTQDLKTGKIEVLPQTISFKLIKYVPLPSFD